MKEEAILQASQAFEEAVEGYRQMQLAQDHQQAANGWSLLLNGAQRFYNKLYAGSKGHPASHQWATTKKAERKADPFLHYLHEARHAHEHGLEESSAEQSTSVCGIPAGELEYNGVKIEIIHNPKTSYLMPVTTNAGDLVVPPAMQEGTEYGRTPLFWFANRVMPMLEALLNEARSLPNH